MNTTDATHGMASHGTPGLGLARQGEARQGLTEMEKTWSLGKTVFTYPVPEDRTIDKDPATMTWEELRDTQDMELPTISRTAWKLTGAGAWSLDRALTNEDSEGTTIADRLPDDHELKAGWQTQVPITDMTIEQLRAYDKWCAEHTRGSRMTPYKTLHPITRWRIQQERDSVRTSPPVSYRIVDQHGNVTVAIRGKKLTDKEYVVEAKAYLRRLRDWLGYVPTLDDIEREYSEAKELWDAIRSGDVGFRKSDYQVGYLMSDETDPYRYELFDELAHTSYEALEEPWIDDTFVTSLGLDPETVADQMPRSIIRHFRSHRDVLRHIADPANSDAFWHARIGSANDLGTDNGHRPRGRRVSLEHVAPGADLDTTSIGALSILTD